MWCDLLIISLWGGIVALDTTAAFQIMISHPLVSGSVVGLLLGNFPLGFAIGIILELIWLNELPIGAASFAEGNIGGTVAAASAILVVEETSRSSPSIALALLLSVLISWIGGHLVIFLRQVNGKIYQSLLRRKRITVKLVSRYHRLATSLSFFLGFILTAVSILLFAYWLFPVLIGVVPSSWDKFLEPMSSAFLGAGFGVMIFMFLQKKYWWLFVISLVGGYFSFMG